MLALEVVFLLSVISEADFISSDCRLLRLLSLILPVDWLRLCWRLRPCSLYSPPPSTRTLCSYARTVSDVLWPQVLGFANSLLPSFLDLLRASPSSGWVDPACRFNLKSEDSMRYCSEVLLKYLLALSWACSLKPYSCFFYFSYLLCSASLPLSSNLSSTSMVWS